MIHTIKRLIDGEKVLLDKFVKMAMYAKNEHELADSIENWFQSSLEGEFIKVVPATSGQYCESLRFVYQSILEEAIANIRSEEWLDIARYYMAKEKEWARRIG